MFLLYQKYIEVKILKPFPFSNVISINTMQSFIHADIFFFISSIAAVVLGVLLIIIFVYLIKILRDVKEISSLAKKESMDLAEDMRMIREEVRGELTRGGPMAFSMFRIIRGLLKRRRN